MYGYCNFEQKFSVSRFIYHSHTILYNKRKKSILGEITKKSVLINDTIPMKQKIENKINNKNKWITINPIKIGCGTTSYDHKTLKKRV